MSGDSIDPGSLILRIETHILPRIERTKFDASQWREIIPITLACSMLEGCWSILKLIQFGMKIQASILFRSLIEAEVEFIRICRDDRFIDEFRLRSEQNWIKTLKLAKKGNPFFSMILNSDDFQKRYEQKLQLVGELEGRGARNSSIRERFESIDALEVYEGFYHKLSDHSHTSLSALIERYISVGEDAPVFRAFHQPEEAEFDPLLDSLSGFLDRFEKKFDERFPG